MTKVDAARSATMNTAPGRGSPPPPASLLWGHPDQGQAGLAAFAARNAFPGIELDKSQMAAARLIGHDVGDARAKSYDILRTHVLQAMDLHSWHLLGITSPTMGCGKTLTSLNLALSISRQAERAVVVVDLDFRKPQIATRLGVKPSVSLLDVLNGRISPSEAMFQVRAGDNSVLVLPTEPTSASAELMASRGMRAVIQDLRTKFRPYVVILDLPPMLVSDDVIAILPQIDCSLLVVSVGSTTLPEIEECSRHLQATNLVRLVVNKVPETKRMYYY